MSDWQLPTDRWYERGIPVETSLGSTPVFQSHGDTPLKEQVEWTRPRPENIQQSTADLVTIRHYANASKLLLCDRIWRQQLGEPIPTIVTEVARQNVEEMMLWGRYMRVIDGTSTVTDKERALYRLLFDESDPVAVLLGMSTLSMLGRYISLEMYDEGDELFNEIATTVIEDMDAQFSRLIEPYRTVIDNLSDAKQMMLRSKQKTYIVYSKESLQQTDTFPVEEWTAEKRWQSVYAPINQFYKDIGLSSLEL